MRAGVEDWSETGNSDQIPADKLGNAPGGVELSDGDPASAAYGRLYAVGDGTAVDDMRFLARQDPAIVRWRLDQLGAGIVGYSAAAIDDPSARAGGSLFPASGGFELLIQRLIGGMYQIIVDRSPGSPGYNEPGLDLLRRREGSGDAFAQFQLSAVAGDLGRFASTMRDTPFFSRDGGRYELKLRLDGTTDDLDLVDASSLRSAATLDDLEKVHALTDDDAAIDGLTDRVSDLEGVPAPSGGGVTWTARSISNESAGSITLTQAHQDAVVDAWSGDNEMVLIFLLLDGLGGNCFSYHPIVVTLGGIVNSGTVQVDVVVPPFAVSGSGIGAVRLSLTLAAGDRKSAQLSIISGGGWAATVQARIYEGLTA